MDYEEKGELSPTPSLVPDSNNQCIGCLWTITIPLNRSQIVLESIKNFKESSSLTKDSHNILSRKHSESFGVAGSKVGFGKIGRGLICVIFNPFYGIILKRCSRIWVEVSFVLYISQFLEQNLQVWYSRGIPDDELKSYFFNTLYRINLTHGTIERFQFTYYLVMIYWYLEITLFPIRGIFLLFNPVQLYFKLFFLNVRH